MRKYPNIIITGTPGTGKTTLCTTLLNHATTSTPPLPLKHLSINDLVKSRSLHSSYDTTFRTYIVDDDKLLNEVESEISDGNDQGGWLIDWHSTDGFAVRWVDFVVVLRCEDTQILFDRLKSRGYPEKKLQENMDAEIFGVIAEEAREGWGEDGRVVELKSEEAEQMEENAERVLEWIKRWMEDRKKEKEEGPGGG